MGAGQNSGYDPGTTVSRTLNWKLVLGPGPTADRLLPWLETARVPGPASGAGHGRGVATGPQRLSEIDGLWELGGAGGRIVLAGEDLRPEDIGLVASFLRRHPGFELVLVGGDPRGSLRRLTADGRARWMVWPPDIEELQDLVRDTGTETGRVNVPGRKEAQARATTPVRAAEQDSSSSQAANTPPSASWEKPGPKPDSKSTRERSELNAIANILAGDSEAPDDGADSGTEDARKDPAPYFRDQVADLANLAQELELSFAMLCQGLDEEKQNSMPVDRLGRSLARLNQFTTTLTYVASPAPAGKQHFDLSQLIDDTLRLFEPEGDSPRPTLHRGGPAQVVSDRGLLTQAFEALFFLARHCAAGPSRPSRPGGPRNTGNTDGKQSPSAPAGAPGSVRLAVGPRAGWAEVSIEFPAGPLEGFALARVTEPYALRRRIPGLGANALRAAQGILRGQGGELELKALPSGDLRFCARLPLSNAAPDETR